MATSTVLTPHSGGDGSSTTQPPPSTPAEAPNHQTGGAWQPVISPSDSDYKDEQAAEAQYTAVYGTASQPQSSGTPPKLLSSYNIPKMTMSYSKAIHLLAQQPPGAGPSG